MLSETFLILRRIERDIIVKVHWYSCKMPIILVSFEWKLNFLDTFSKNFQITKFHENSCSGTKFFHADGQEERHDDDNSRFSRFCEDA